MWLRRPPGCHVEPGPVVSLIRCVLTWTRVQFFHASVRTPSGSWEDATCPRVPTPRREPCARPRRAGDSGDHGPALSPSVHTSQVACCKSGGRGRGRVLSQRNNSGARGVAAGWHRSCAFEAGDAGLGMKVSIDRIHPGSPGEPRACVTTRNSAARDERRRGVQGQEL